MWPVTVIDVTDITKKLELNWGLWPGIERNAEPDLTSDGAAMGVRQAEAGQMADPTQQAIAVIWIM